MKKKPILIAGSIALDTIETSNGRREGIIGGSTTYATVAAGLDAPVHVVGVIGSDFPQEGHELYGKYASDLTDLASVPGQTFSWGGRYHDNGDERTTLFTELGVFAEFNPTISAVNRQVPLVFLANIHPQLQFSIIEQCHPESLIVTDTMNLWIDTTADELKAVLLRTDILLINETEAQSLSGKENLADAAIVLKDMGPDIVVIKQGSSGASLFQGEQRIDIGVFPIEAVVDPTGAGDSFGGGFMASLSDSYDLVEALVNGSALASFCVEGFGVERLVSCEPEELIRRKEYLRGTVKS